MNRDTNLSDRVKGLEESVSFFGRKCKHEREVWVARSFLDNSNVKYEISEIVCPTNDPPDIEFRDALFEIKEILDPGRRRHDEYKEALEVARNALDTSELDEFVRPITLTLDEIFSHCLGAMDGLAMKYPRKIREGLDLLMYFNMLNVFRVIEFPYPNVSGLDSSGWRSISFVKGNISSCFFAKEDAPEFIRQLVGHVAHKEAMK